MSGKAQFNPAVAPEHVRASSGEAGAPRWSRKEFTAAKQRYLTLAETDPERASRYALAMLPRFADHQFFYMRIFRSADVVAKRKAAVLTVREAIASGNVPSRVLGSAIGILDELREASAELEMAREIHERQASEADDHLALSKVARRERRTRDAYRHLEAHLQARDGDRKGIIARGVLAWRSGRWGERIDAIEAMRPHSCNRRVADILNRFDGFLSAIGTDSVKVRLQDAATRAALQGPASIYELVCRVPPPPSKGQERHGVVIMIPTLGVGGAERIVAHIHRALMDRGEAVALWLHATTDRRGDDGLFYLPLAGADRESLQIIPPSEPAGPPFTWLQRTMGSRAQAIYDRLVIARPRAVHLSLDGPNLAGGLAAVAAGVPRIVLHCHNMWPGRLFTGEDSTFGWERAYRALLLRPEVSMVAVGQTVADDYLSRIGSDLTAKVSIVHNGFDFSPFTTHGSADRAALRRSMGIPDGVPVIGSAFRFEEVKRPELWLDMAALVHAVQPDAHFVVFGDGVLLPKAREYAAELGLHENVHFPGRTSDLYHRLQLLDVFVLASRSEGLPNVLVEAQAAGAIPVAFNVGGCSETFLDGVTGRLVSSETAEALAGEVLSVLSDDAWRSAARVKGHQFVQSAFSLDAMTARMSDVLCNGP